MMLTMKFGIIKLDEFSGPKAMIYSIILEGDDMTLLDHFFEDNAGCEPKLTEIAFKLKTMGNETGCRIQYFKENEGSPGDGMIALRCGHLRLYCLRYDSSCIFICSGGYKPPGISAYQEDSLLNEKALLTRKIIARINKAIIEREMSVNDDGSIEMKDDIDLEI